MKSLSQLSEGDWKDIRNRLRLFTFKKYGWLERQAGLDLEGIIQDAIVDTLLGKRRWPPINEQGEETELDLFIFLCGTIRSKVNHVLAIERRKVPLAEYLEENLFYSEHESDHQAVYKQLCNRIRILVLDDPILIQIMDLWFDRPELKPRDIANLLGLQDEEIRNAQKRLRRRLQSFKEEWINA